MADYIPSTPRSSSEIRTELDKIAAAIRTVLHRDGTAPNQMSADLDMDGNWILNAKFDTSQVDLSDYYTKTEADVITDAIDAKADNATTIAESKLGEMDLEGDTGSVNVNRFTETLRVYGGTNCSTDVVESGQGGLIKQVIIDVPNGSTSEAGAVQLYDGYDLEDSSLAATAKAVHDVNDKVDSLAGSVGYSPNLLLNANFAEETPDDSQPKPDATPRDYAPDHQVFKYWYADETLGAEGLTYDNGYVSGISGAIYQDVPVQNGIEYLTQFIASLSDKTLVPNESGISYTLVGDVYRVKIAFPASNIFVSKFETGNVATKADVSNFPELQYREGTNAEILARVPAIGELLFNTDDGSIHMGDGATQGGFKHVNINMVDLKFSSISDMLSGNPTITPIGKVCSTGYTKFKRVSGDGSNLSHYEALTPVSVGDLGVTDVDLSTVISYCDTGNYPIAFDFNNSQFESSTAKTIPQNVKVFMRGGIISATAELLVEGNFICDYGQAFTKDSLVVFGSDSIFKGYLKWFGFGQGVSAADNKTAIISAYKSTRFQQADWLVPRGDFNVDGGLFTDAPFNLRGASMSGANSVSGWFPGAGASRITFVSGADGFHFPNTGALSEPNDADDFTFNDLEMIGSGVQNIVRYRGGKRFNRCQFKDSNGKAIFCEDYVEVSSFSECVFLNNAGADVSIGGSLSTTWYMDKCMFKGGPSLNLEITGALNFSVTNTTVEDAQGLGIHIIQTDGSSLSHGRFETLWLENNATDGTSLYAVRIETLSTDPNNYPCEIVFDNGRVAPVNKTTPTQLSAYVGENCKARFIRSRMFPDVSNTIQIDGEAYFESLDEPLPRNIPGSGIAIEKKDSDQGIIFHKDTQQRSMTVGVGGVIPEAFNVSDGETVRIGYSGGSGVCQIQLWDEATQEIAIFALYTSGSGVAQIVNTAAKFEVSSTPAAGKWGVFKSAAGQVSIVNNNGAAQNIKVSMLGCMVDDLVRV